MSNILVTGSKGQLGQELRFLSSQFPQFDFTYIDIEDLDITNVKAVRSFFAAKSYQYLINCAAYTAVDQAESNANIAQKVNVEGPRNLALASREHGTTMLHLSTDYVYHNQQNTPFKEEDTTCPQSVYAQTKLEGDQVVLQELEQAAIIRTSWVYSTFGHNFVKTMIRLGTERNQLGIVFDQIGTPTYARDLALVLLNMIDSLKEGQVSKDQLHGVYHYSNEGVCSWYDFALAIFEMKEISCKTLPIETSAYPTPAKRPPFSVLNKAKIKGAFGIEIPHWRDALKRMLNNLEG